MQYISTIIMGIVEGLTEFLPVSSTGHLILVENLINFQADENHFFEVFIQLGAILAVVCLYLHRFVGFLNLKKQPEPSFCGLNGIIKISIACLPVFILGALFQSGIKESLFAPVTVAAALLVGAALMIMAEKIQLAQSWRKTKAFAKVDKLEALTNQQALLIGIFQCLALWPGMSRSASTIVGAMFCGVSRAVAAEFSFLIAVPVMCAAVGYDCLKSWDNLEISLLPIFILGFIVSFISALVAIKLMLAILNKWTLLPFAYYRIILGIIVLGILYV
jgi:undecaprenyl-diphosphatase